MITKDIERTICVSLFENMLNNIENNLNNYTPLKTNVKYHNENFNKSLKNDIDQIVEVLQNVVDKFYLNYYEVNNFTFFTNENINYAKEENLKLVSSAKKLLKFIN